MNDKIAMNVGAFDGFAGIDDLIPDLVRLRRDLHANPELAYQEHRTAAIVAAELRELGLEVHEGIGRTGVVGVLRRGEGRRIGLRADMDALPMEERSGLPHASRLPGAHHGCGHDGHTAMLLGAARQLARSGTFSGTVNFIFQPAEEGQGGARRMVQEGLFERFPCDAVYALHNWPDLPAGQAKTRPGPIMAAADRFDIVVKGRGGHAAMPHRTPDAILAASQIVAQLNTLVARRIDPNESAVLSVTRIEGGHSHNVIPAEVTITGTVRSFDAQSQDALEAALRDSVEGLCRAAGCEASVNYNRYYPATVNTPERAALALKAAAIAGLEASLAERPAFTSEDFAFMLRERPGAYLWLGQGPNAGTLARDVGSGGDREDHGDVYRPLHHPCYDFNDRVLASGVRWFVAVVALEAEPQ